MKLIIWVMILSVTALAKNYKSKCSLYNSLDPLCYHSREKAELNVALLYYGDFWNLEDLDRIEPILKERFFKATGNLVDVNILIKKVLPYKNQTPNDFSYGIIKDPKRLQRIWYYENVNAKIITEVYEQYKKSETKEIMNKLDAVLAITGAQFEGLGFANGRISVTEQPREIAFGLPGGGRMEVVSDYQIVDELIHELGHNMFLGHTSTQCQKSDMTYQESRKCCELSPSKNDVLSYCRKRNKVNDRFMYGFESCNQKMISDLIIPAMIKGKRWNVKNRSRCE